MRAVILFSLVWALSGCASLSGRRQHVIIRTNPTGAEVRVDGKSYGPSPVLASIERGYSPQIQIVNGTQILHYDLETNWRWNTFFSNLLFLSFAPVAIAVDVVTGATWQMENEYLVPAGSKLLSPVQPHEQEVLAVAPPIADHANISDQTGRLISVEIRKQMKRFNAKSVLPYEFTRPIFNDRNVDYDNSGQKSDLNDLYGQTGATQIFYGRVDSISNPKQVQIKGELRDLLHPTEDHAMIFAFDKEKVPSIGEVGWTTRKSEIFTFFPNSIFAELSNSQTRLSIGQQQIAASSEVGTDFASQSMRYLGAFSIRRVTPRPYRTEWRYRLLFVPAIGFSMANETFSLIPAIEDVDFSRAHFELGYGPSFNYGNNKWNLYFNIIPVFAYDSISAEKQGRTLNEHNTQGTMTAEFGLLYAFNSRWSLRAFSKSTTVPEGVWRKVIRDYTGTNIQVSGATFVSSGISFGYTFPNKDLPF